jgi:DNA replication protein
VRPSIYAIYEQSIGPLTPMIAEQLEDAVKSYSQEWVLEAIQVAVDRNVRKWAYISAILERKRTKFGSPNEGTPTQVRENRLSQLETEYADLINKYED